MDRMLYVAMTGAKQMLLAQSSTNNNLANANTSGFRADVSVFRAMPVFGPGHPSRVYAMAERPGVKLAPGTAVTTGNELDVAITGPGWIAVQAPDGHEAYTRAGDLRLTSNGLLTTGAGYPVLGNGGPISIPASEKIDIGTDGTISILPVGQAATALTEVDRIKLVNPPLSSLIKDSYGLLSATPGTNVAPDANVRVSAGSLESSNVNTADMLANMISTARQFELQVKVIRTTEENDAAATQLMRIS